MATILIVDDDAGTRQLYTSLLGHFGNQMIEAVDGRDALRLAQERRPDLILSDILMPTMNGYDFVSSLRKLPGMANTKVVFQSASFLDHESRALGESCGVEHYLTKPCEPEKILQTVNEVLGLPASAPPTLAVVNGRNDPVSLMVDAVYDKGQQFDALAARLSSLVEFGIQAAQLTSEEDLLRAALSMARKLIGSSYAGGGFVLASKDNCDEQYFSCFRVAGLAPRDVVRIRKQTAGSVLQEIYDKGKSMWLHAKDEQLGVRLPEAHPSVRSFLGMPIKTSDHIYGVLYVADKLGGGEFSEEDSRMLATLAARIAIGYENILREQSLQQQMSRLKREVQQRQQAEDRFRLLVESSPMGILLCDSSGRITEANSQLQKMFGYTRKELVGNPVEMLVPEAKRGAHAQHRSEYANTHIARPMGLGMELYGRTKDGGTFPVEVSLGPLLATDQPMISSTVVDITERKKLEEQLRVSQRLEAVGQLAAGIAHDFNNILTAISGNTKLALADLPTGHPVQQNLEEIDKAALRATNVVRQILSFSRQDPAKRETVALASVVDEAMKLLRAGLRANITVETEYDADLPPVSADSTQIHQIVMNLATNAADAIGDKPGVLKLKISMMEADGGGVLAKSLPKPGRYVCLSLSDNGSGIDAVTAGRIFEPFFTTKPRGRGTGLGLSVVHGIVQQHGGAITVESKPDQGTTFFIHLPVAEDKVVGRSQASPTENPRGQGENILYVDDEEPLVFLATRMLERQGYQVTGCTDPAQALAMFRANPKQFDAVVSDLSMPTMSGTDLAQELLRIRPGLPIVLASGYIRPQDNECARALGLPDVILKPDTVEDLSQILRNVLEQPKNSPVAGSHDKDSRGNRKKAVAKA